MHHDCIILTPSLQPRHPPRGNVPALDMIGAWAQMATGNIGYQGVRQSDLIITQADWGRRVSSLTNATTDPLRSTKVYPTTTFGPG